MYNSTSRPGGSSLRDLYHNISPKQSSRFSSGSTVRCDACCCQTHPPTVQLSRHPSPAPLVGHLYSRSGSGVATIFGPPRQQLVWAPGQGVTATTSSWRALAGPGGPLQPRGPPRSRGACGGPSLRHCGAGSFQVVRSRAPLHPRIGSFLLIEVLYSGQLDRQPITPPFCRIWRSIHSSEAATVTIDPRAFAVACPAAWNSLPTEHFD